MWDKIADSTFLPVASAMTAFVGLMGLSVGHEQWAVTTFWLGIGGIGILVLAGVVTEVRDWRIKTRS